MVLHPTPIVITGQHKRPAIVAPTMEPGPTRAAAAAAAAYEALARPASSSPRRRLNTPGMKVAPIPARKAAHAFTSFRPASRGADFSLVDSWPKVREPWNVTGGRLLLPQPEESAVTAITAAIATATAAAGPAPPPGRRDAPAAKSPRLRGVKDAATVSSPLSSSRSPRRFVATADASKRGEGEAPPPSRPAEVRPGSGGAPHAAVEPDARPESPRPSASPAEGAGAAAAAAAGAAAGAAGAAAGAAGAAGGAAGAAVSAPDGGDRALAQTPSPSKRPAVPAPPAPMAQLIWTESKWKQLLGPSVQRTSSWKKPAFLAKISTIALFQSLLAEMEPPKPKVRRRKPKVNPLDSAEESEYETVDEDAAGDIPEGEKEEWSDEEPANAEDVGAGSPVGENGAPAPPKLVKQNTSRQLLGNEMGETPQSTPSKSGGLLLRAQAAGESGGLGGSSRRRKDKTTQEASALLGGAESGVRRKLPYTSGEDADVEEEEEEEPPAPPPPEKKLVGFDKFNR